MHLVWTRQRLVIGGIVIVAACIVADALCVEPQWIEVTHHRIAAPLSTSLKIAHLTDIHTSHFGSRERRMLRIVEAEQPDLIVITGDSINITSDYPAFREALTGLHAPLGVWVVRGNHEDWWPINNEQEFYESAGAKLLVNANHEAREGVWLIGFDDLFGGSRDADKAFAGVPESAYKIALFHSPVYFEPVAGRCNLALAGHSHGGQVCLPIIGPLWLPPFSGKYVAGWFQQRGTQMYVSRGVGTTIIDVRFCCRPEIAIISVGG